VNVDAGACGQGLELFVNRHVIDSSVSVRRSER
jgi:hypothetical protein